MWRWGRSTGSSPDGPAVARHAAQGTGSRPHGRWPGSPIGARRRDKGQCLAVSRARPSLSTAITSWPRDGHPKTPFAARRVDHCPSRNHCHAAPAPSVSCGGGRCRVRVSHASPFQGVPLQLLFFHFAGLRNNKKIAHRSVGPETQKSSIHGESEETIADTAMASSVSSVAYPAVTAGSTARSWSSAHSNRDSAGT